MALDSNKIADNFIDQIKQGSSPIPKQDNTVVVTDDTEPSAVGGLAALGATVIGATALGRRIPGIKSFLRPFGKTPKTPTTITANKPVEEIGNMPTATGQSSELITTPGKELVPGRSRIGEVQNIPFTMGKGYKDSNPIVGSSTFDRVMEAPFETGTAKQWTDWLTKANRADLKVSTGPLAGVSRRVTPDELEELNLIKFDKQGKGVDGFLKVMDDQNIPIDRDTLLEMVKTSPINSLKTLRLGVRGDPEAEVLDVLSSLRIASNKIPNKNLKSDELVSDISGELRALAKKLDDQQGVIGSGTYTDIQDKLVKLGREVDNPQDFSTILQKFNKTVGEYNKYGQKVELPQPLKFRGSKERDSGYFPAYKTQRSYALQGGENYTEDVIYYAKALPNVRGGRFSNLAQSPHFVDNEIGFIRYDDLPNPKLGTNARHMRVSEAQTDIHSAQFDADNKAEYFKLKKNPFNTDGAVRILKKQRDDLLARREPFDELGRGIAGLTKSQRQEIARINYEIAQLEKSGMAKLAAGSQLEATTAAPLAKSWPDYVAKNLLRNMAERNINALSIVPSSMNKGVKMPAGKKLGDEINYGLMDGKALIRDSEGRLKKTNQLAAMVAPLKKLANQYGAKFEMAPMPKSNPNKPFKIIAEYTMKGDDSIKLGRKHYNKKIGDKYIFEDHIGAARTMDEAEELLRIKDKESFGNDKIKYIIKEIGAENPDLYEMVPTLIASDDVLKKFLLPMKAYMYQGGFVDKTNIFKGLL